MHLSELHKLNHIVNALHETVHMISATSSADYLNSLDQFQAVQTKTVMSPDDKVSNFLIQSCRKLT
jgi:hypothetical protein